MGSTQEAFVGSIDQGTTSSRFLIFNKQGEPVASHQLEFKQIYPQPGYVCARLEIYSVLILAGGMSMIL